MRMRSIVRSEVLLTFYQQFPFRSARAFFPRHIKLATVWARLPPRAVLEPCRLVCSPPRQRTRRPSGAITRKNVIIGINSHVVFGGMLLCFSGNSRNRYSTGGLWSCNTHGPTAPPLKVALLGLKDGQQTIARVDSPAHLTLERLQQLWTRIRRGRLDSEDLRICVLGKDTTLLRKIVAWILGCTLRARYSLIVCDRNHAQLAGITLSALAAPSVCQHFAAVHYIARLSLTRSPFSLARHS